MLNLFDDLEWRGLVYQVTDRERARTALAHGAGLRAYIGFDPTATSLHVGSLLPITLLMRMQRAGHHPIALVGGGTGQIGDPSGKSAERTLLDLETTETMKEAVRNQLHGFLSRESSNFSMVDNVNWLGEAKLLDFLRDVGKHFSVNTMVQRDSVRTRLETRDQGISYTEFSYMLLQAYDFLELFKRHGCRAQFGGSDQWGNIVSGINLIDRLADHPENAAPFGLTVPLITTKSGQKFGKTEAGAVWLDEHLTTPYKFYQFWINTDDDDAAKYLRYFTFLDRATIEALEVEHRPAPHLRVLQKRLAHELTTLVHSDLKSRVAQEVSAILFGQDPRDATVAALFMLALEIPYQSHASPELVNWHGVLVGPAESHPFRSNGEAKRALTAGSVYWNGKRVTEDLGSTIGRNSLVRNHYGLLRTGKKTYYLTHFD